MITQRVNDINSYSGNVYPFLITLVYFMQLKYRRSHDEETPSLLWMHFYVQIWGDVQGDLGSFEDRWVGEAAMLLNGLASQVAPLEGIQCWDWSGTHKINTQVQYFTFLQWITVIAGRHIFLCALFLKSSMQSSIKQREVFFFKIHPKGVLHQSVCVYYRVDAIAPDHFGTSLTLNSEPVYWSKKQTDDLKHSLRAVQITLCLLSQLPSISPSLPSSSTVRIRAQWYPERGCIAVPRHSATLEWQGYGGEVEAKEEKVVASAGPRPGRGWEPSRKWEHHCYPPRRS